MRFPEKDFALGEETVNIINVTANGLENYINPIDKVVAGSERFYYSRRPYIGKMLPEAMVFDRAVVYERRSHCVVNLVIF